MFITGKKNEDEAIQSLFRGQVNVVIYTQGAQGATIYTKDDYRIHHEGYQVQAIDTTGAGDAFIGAIIYCILESRHSECKDLFKEKGKIYWRLVIVSQHLQQRNMVLLKVCRQKKI